MSENTIDGTWYSSVGSKLIIEEHGRELTGEFDSSQEPSGFLPIHGSIDPDRAVLHRALSFSVSWAEKNTPPGMRSVTSYSGQYRADHDEIDVIFLLINDNFDVLWKATHIAAEHFTRTPPN